jgi:ATP-dependent Clp protease, protease subunit
MPSTAQRKKRADRRTHGLVINKTGTTAEILLYDPIGVWGISARQFVQDLAGLGMVDEITVRINSPGGEVFDAIAIYNALYAHPAKVITQVDGVAASAAGFVLQAGDVRRMHANATFHCHPAQGGVYGSADEIAAYLTLLRNADEIISRIFAARTGLDDAELSELLGKDTWLKAEDALDRGFIDEVIDGTASRSDNQPENNSEPTERAPDLTAAKHALECLATIATELGVTLVTQPTTPPAVPTNTAPPAAPPAVPPVAAAPAPATPPVAAPVADPPPAPVAKPPVNESAEIVRLCVACGVPAKAADYLENKTPLTAVQADLLQMQIAARPVSPTPPGNFDGPAKKPEDPDAKFKAEYAAAEKVFQRQGVTIDAYVKSRRKDEGLE